MLELWRISVNEWVKLVRRKRLWVCALLGLALVALFTYGGYRNQQNMMRFESPAALQGQIQNTKTALANEKASSDANKTQMVEQMQQQLQGLQNQYQMAEASQSANWKAALQKHIQSLEQQKSLAASNGDQQQVGQLESQIMQAHYSISHNAKPSPSWIVTPYQILSEFIGIASQIFLPLITVILVADMVAGETTSGTIKLLLIRPASRAKVLVAKWLVGLFGTTVLTLAISFAFLGISSLVLGGGGGADPQIVGVSYTFATQPGSSDLMAIAHYTHAHVISMAMYGLESILLTALSMLAVATIAFLCSVLFQSAMASTAVALGVVIVGTISMQLVHGNWIVALFPVHLNLVADWTGQLAAQLKMSIGLSTGLLVLGLWTLAAIAVSLFRFTRRDVLNA